MCPRESVPAIGRALTDDTPRERPQTSRHRTRQADFPHRSSRLALEDDVVREHLGEAVEVMGIERLSPPSLKSLATVTAIETPSVTELQATVGMGSSPANGVWPPSARVRRAWDRRFGARWI